MAKQEIKFEKTWDENYEDEVTVGKPFHVLESAHDSDWLRFVYDEITNTLSLHGADGKAIMYIENGDIKEFFKRTLEMRKTLKDHPLDILI